MGRGVVAATGKGKLVLWGGVSPTVGIAAGAPTDGLLGFDAPLSVAAVPQATDSRTRAMLGNNHFIRLLSLRYMAVLGRSMKPFPGCLSVIPSTDKGYVALMR